MTWHARHARFGLGFSALTLALAGGSCGGGGAKPGPCNHGELTGCGAVCDAASGCAEGLFCDEQGTCTAECADATVARDCGAGATCTDDGRCEGGATGDGDGGDGDGDGMSTGGDGDGTDDGVCADVAVVATAVTPNVVVVIDQSGSMTDPFDGDLDRWTALKNALLADDGLIAELQGLVRFGVALYTYDEDKDSRASCPVVTPGTLTVSLNALEDIRRVYMPAEPGDNTPTGEALQAVTRQVQAGGLVGPDVREPTIFVLATDGNPDTCDEPNQNGADQALDLSVNAVKSAYALGIRTYVIAVGAELEQDHINDLANAGVGDDAAPGQASAPSYRVDDDQGLRDALRTIVGGQLSCDVKLQGKVVGNACDGTVTLGGNPLLCDDADGWELVDESSIRLQGAACDGLKAGQLLTAKFPCDAVIVL